PRARRNADVIQAFGQAVVFFGEVGRRLIRGSRIAQGDHGLDATLVHRGLKAGNGHLAAAIQDTFTHRTEVAYMDLPVMGIAPWPGNEQRGDKKSEETRNGTGHVIGLLPKRSVASLITRRDYVRKAAFGSDENPVPPQTGKSAKNKYPAKIARRRALSPTFPQASRRTGGLGGATGRGFRQTKQPAKEANERPSGTIEPVRFRHDRPRHAVGQVRAEDQKKHERQVPENVDPALVGVPELNADYDGRGKREQVRQVLGGRPEKRRGHQRQITDEHRETIGRRGWNVLPESFGDHLGLPGLPVGLGHGGLNAVRQVAVHPQDDNDRQQTQAQGQEKTPGEPGRTAPPVEAQPGREQQDREVAGAACQSEKQSG